MCKTAKEIDHQPEHLFQNPILFHIHAKRIKQCISVDKHYIILLIKSAIYELVFYFWSYTGLAKSFRLKIRSFSKVNNKPNFSFMSPLQLTSLLKADKHKSPVYLALTITNKYNCSADLNQNRERLVISLSCLPLN